MSHFARLLFCLVLIPICSYAEPLPSQTRKGDLVILDDQYLRGQPKGWKVPTDYHEAFGRHGDIPHEIRFGRFGLHSGKFLYTTWRPLAPLSDQAYTEGKTTIRETHTSDLITPSFDIKLDFVTFLLSGGNMPNEACINLLVDGKVARSATGRNHDILKFVAFEVKEFRGKKAQIQVLDTTTAAFGYVTVDCICQSPDPKGAVRVITTLPSRNNGAGRVETLAGQFAGLPSIVEGKLRVGETTLNLKDVLSWDTGFASADSITGNRMELTNGDMLGAEILGLEEKKLVVKHTLFGEIRLSVDDVAQTLFLPGPTVEAAPGTLIHSNGNKIPGELLWIRKDNISIKCALGVVPLPKARVRAFVFSKLKQDKVDTDTIILTDGSTLTGKLSPGEDGLLLTHDSLGALKLPLENVSRVKRALPGVTSLGSLEGKLSEQVGPITPPAPVLVQSPSGTSLRMFPRTAMQYSLPKGTGAKTFKATLMPVANCGIPMTAHIHAGSVRKTYVVPPSSPGVKVDLDLGTATEIEIVTDSTEAISYPCGIEWRNAFIVERKQP